MTRRARFTAGILALMAMTFSLAETAWSSTCAPSMDMHAADATAAEEAPGQDCMSGLLADHDGGPDDENEPPCPFTPAAVQGCAGVASLPASGVADAADAVQSTTDIFLETTQHDLFLRYALFHPPRA